MDGEIERRQASFAVSGVFASRLRTGGGRCTSHSAFKTDNDNTRARQRLSLLSSFASPQENSFRFRAECRGDYAASGGPISFG